MFAWTVQDVRDAPFRGRSHSEQSPGSRRPVVGAVAAEHRLGVGAADNTDHGVILRPEHLESLVGLPASIFELEELFGGVEIFHAQSKHLFGRRVKRKEKKSRGCVLWRYPL